jgi:hypothetical protein
MTNAEQIKTLNPKLQEKYINAYRKHPLHDFIDWDSFLGSTDGNEMHFLKSQGSFIDEQGRTNIILEKVIINNKEYRKVYIVENNSFARTIC